MKAELKVLIGMTLAVVVTILLTTAFAPQANATSITYEQRQSYNEHVSMQSCEVIRADLGYIQNISDTVDKAYQKYMEGVGAEEVGSERWQKLNSTYFTTVSDLLVVENILYKHATLKGCSWLM